MVGEKKSLKSQETNVDGHFSKEHLSKETEGHPHSHDLGIKRIF